MNADERKKLLAESLREAAKQGEQERVNKATVARITAAVTAKLGLTAETSKPMSCPHCGEPLPESWRTDPTTSGTSEDDEDNESDDDDDDDDDDDRADKAAALKAKYANRKLTVVDRILVNRGIDPFTED
jgi:hypothetical protein